MLSFKTDNPSTLLQLFDDAVAGQGNGKQIDTWRKVEGPGTKGPMYTHKSQQHANRAYFEVAVSRDELLFGLYWPGGRAPADAVYLYAYYHGHLIETFIHHFGAFFESVTSSAQYTPAKST